MVCVCLNILLNNLASKMQFTTPNIAILEWIIELLFHFFGVWKGRWFHSGDLLSVISKIDENLEWFIMAENLMGIFIPDMNEL